MVWYYAEGDRQRGPISDEEFQELVNKGRIHQETLIWKDGMDTWQPLDNAREAGLVNISPASPPASAPPAGPSIPWSPPPASASHATPDHQQQTGGCAQCGRGPLGPNESVQLGNLLLCRNCDADLARHYQQTAQQQGTAWPHAVAPQPAATGPAVPGSVALPFASILTRAAAKIIDNLIESVVMLIIMALTTDLEAFGEAVSNMGTAPEQLIIALRPYIIASLIFRVLYEAILITGFGATLGKMALGIRVVVSDGSPPRINHAVIRAVAPAILQIPVAMMPQSGIAQIAQFIFFFGYLIAVFDLQKRTLYDHMANTRVVK